MTRAANGSTDATIAWTSYNQPASINAPSLNSSSQFSYDANHQRWMQSASYSGSLENTEYIGDLLEKMTNSSGTAYRYYVPAGNNYIVYNRWSTGSNPIYYVTKDHLDSSAVISSSTGSLVVKEKFAALGWNENSGTEEATMATVTRHEFTGQEGLDNAGLWLVNMNGRIYQPSGAFFLSPDPNITDPLNPQNYNRYAYALNNPLTNTDPTGFDWCNEDVCPPDTDLPDPDPDAASWWTAPVIPGNIPPSQCAWGGCWSPSQICGKDWCQKGTFWYSYPWADFAAIGVSAVGMGLVGMGNSSGGSGARTPQGDQPPTSEVTITAQRPSDATYWSPFPSFYDAPYLAPYPAGPVRGPLAGPVYRLSSSIPGLCYASRSNNPNLQRNIVTGATGGFLAFGTIGAVVTLNIVGFPEVELAEGGAAAIGGGAWLFEAAVAEPAGSMAIGGLSAGAYGTTLGGIGGYVSTSATCQ